MASVQSESIKKLYGSWLTAMTDKPDMELDEIRALFEHWGDITGEPGQVDYLEVDAGGVEAMWAIPKGCAEDRVALCTHGGGYVTGSMYTHRKLFGHIAKEVGCKALILHYRRAPEHTHPAQVNDAVTAYEWLLKEGYKSEHIFTTGDSAGGALATSVLLGIRNKGLALPVGAAPLSPWYDPEGTGDSIQSNAEKDVLVQKEVLLNMAATFLGDASANVYTSRWRRNATRRFCAFRRIGKKGRCGLPSGNFSGDAARVPLYGRRGPRGRRGYYQNSEMG